jgi:hypothetical protein
MDTVREGTVEVNGVRIFYREVGTGAPILLTRVLGLDRLHLVVHPLAKIWRTPASR